MTKAELSLGHFYVKKNQLALAKKHLTKAEKRANSLGLIPVSTEICLLLSQVFEKEKNNTQALLYHKKHIAFKDSIFNQNQQKLVHELETKYQLKEKENALNKLNAEKAFVDLRLHKANRQRIVFLAALLGLSLLAALGFYLFKIKKDSNRLLEEKNQIITNALAEKEILLREIHHRVKNNLQVISSILKLQSVHLSDENALAAITEGRNRVHSMALIHQNLYRDDNVTSIDAEEYIKKLAETLFNSYNITPEKITLQTKIDSMMLDVDTAIPLGLILNELISNALKHAFGKSATGVLSVNLSESTDGLLLSVTDNGSGFEQSEIKVPKGKSFGMELVELLSEKLEATLNIASKHGTTVELLIKNYKLA